MHKNQYAFSDSYSGSLMYAMHVYEKTYFSFTSDNHRKIIYHVLCTLFTFFLLVMQNVFKSQSIEKVEQEIYRINLCLDNSPEC